MAFEIFTQPSLPLFVLIGVVLGIVVGSIPGLTGAMLISLTLPLTFGMPAGAALTLLVAMYVGSVSGGLISATILHMPGTPASVITTLDGYPMAQAGRANRALALGIGASLIGGLLSWVALVLLAQPVARLSTLLGPFEFLSLVLMAFALVAGVSGDSIVRGSLSCAAGVLCALPGIAPGTGLPRLTLGFSALDDGFKLLPVLIGLFAMSRVFSPQPSAGGNGRDARENPILLLPWKTWKRQIVNLLRSSTIGTGIGILPGVGANIGSLVAYSSARGVSKPPEKFGTGCDEGIVASESANNATVGGALVPLIALGIPGSVIDAILLGAFVIHGLQPGALLFSENPEVVATITSSFLWANVAMFAIMTLAARPIARIARVPWPFLMPAIAAFCVLGSYALANRFFDVWVMVGFGVLGFLFDRWKIPLAPFVIGFVLTPLAEESLVTALTSSGGSYLPLVTRPISLTFLVLGALLLALSLRRRRATVSVAK